MSSATPIDLESLARRVQVLEDRQAILDCVHRYCRGLDRHDDEILASAFHADAIDSHGSFVGPIDEFVRFANDGHAKTTLSHTHNITSHTVEIDGDTAHAESYVIFALRLRDGETVHVGGGRYVDRLEKRDGDWRISRRQLIMDWRFEADGRAWASRPKQAVGSWGRDDPSYMRPFELPAEALERLEARRKSEAAG